MNDTPLGHMYIPGKKILGLWDDTLAVGTFLCIEVERHRSELLRRNASKPAWLVNGERVERDPDLWEELPPPPSPTKEELLIEALNGIKNAIEYGNRHLSVLATKALHPWERSSR